MPLDVCIVSGSRADWGLLSAVARPLRDDAAFNLSLVATGSHLAERFGNTATDIRKDGFAIDREIPILDDGDDAAAVTRAMGRAVAGFSEALPALDPDIVMLLGDRYEILAAAQACLIARIPVAHLCGGDITEGAFDDAIRHAISKMGHLHFVSNEPAARRLRAMGEEPDRITVSGSPGLDAIKAMPLLSRDEILGFLGLPADKPVIAVTFHPTTLGDGDETAQFGELTAALDQIASGISIVITGSNADPEGSRLTGLAKAYAASRANACYHTSLGQKRYLSLLKHAKAVVGNSSSGLYEAPSFGIATVNIGDRQKGRLRATSVIDVAPERAAIAAALREALTQDYSGTVNPYGDGHAAKRIIARLKQVDRPCDLLRKTFFEGSVQ